MTIEAVFADLSPGKTKHLLNMTRWIDGLFAGFFIRNMFACYCKEKENRI